MSAAESAAIVALGPLFKVTEVYLWDDAIFDAPQASAHFDNLDEAEESSIYCITGEINSTNKHYVDDYTSVEDFELAQQMDALGLPTSFSTTKEATHKNIVPNRGKRKGMRVKSVTANKDIENRVSRALRPCLLEDSALPRVLYDSTNMPACMNTVEGNIGPSFPDVDDDEDMHVDSKTDVTLSNWVEDELGPGDPDADIKTEASLGVNLQNFHGNDLEETKSVVQHKEEILDKQPVENYVEGSSIPCYITGGGDDGGGDDGADDGLKLADQHVFDYLDDSMCFEFGEWTVIWDPFYNRNYFYNSQTQESTWYPPQGLEHFVMSSSMSNANEVLTDENGGAEFVCDAIQDTDLHSSHKNIDSFECRNHSSEVLISPRTRNELSVNCGSEHGIAEKITNEQVLLHLPDIMGHTTGSKADELYSNKCWEQQNKHITFSEACGLSDDTDSLIPTYKGVGYDEDKGDTCTMDELQNFQEVSSKNKKRRARRIQSQLSLEGADEGLPDSIIKYWFQRYLLFSQFDNGVKMDEEGWFSVTPESIARHHASRCGSGIIIDCFTGVGGNAIQFAMRSNHVIAVDIDAQKIDYAQHNAAIYGVGDNINFINGDFLQLAPRLKGDVIFMSPPWGGPDYNKVQTYDICSMLKPRDGQYLFNIARMIASKVVMFLPRNVDLNQLAELSLSVDPPWALEVEKNYLNDRLKAVTAYFDNPESDDDLW